ncbi:histidine kinase dimerization/phosphoacceptor domain-containing protein [Streptomyces sp. JV185]|uniref:histidine kinase dimerization/phosphoacceptor domain-containing protein n=1 Tax=Streptomyces sp. JV185 TaxID=858638 RepID=UPI002E7A155F|nr:histidine kinase dimerization/phosphoacceptor domain-containing protein [Streptomyces sp. JV185]MEE1767696.1 histidine kinase dimerization/phosphoacceptor domain-containing protein [Streptomyces sp. JV185]
MRIRDIAARVRGRALGAGPLGTDLLVALLVQAAMTMPFVVPRAPELPEATWTSYGLTTLMVLPLVARRRAPVAVLLAVPAAGALYTFTVDGPGQPLPYTGLVAFRTVAELSSPPKRIGIAVLTAAAVLVSVGLGSDDLRELFFSLFVFAAAYAFGRFTVTRRAYLRAVEYRSRQLELTHRIEAEQAAVRERARIAREMHDVLSHAVSLVIVQAEAGPVAVTRALFSGQVGRGPLLQEMFALPDSLVREFGTGKPAAYSAGLSVMRLGGREVRGKTGGRWGYNTAVAATRDLSRTLVYSVNSTDAKGEGMNPTAMNIVVAAFGAPSAG